MNHYPFKIAFVVNQLTSGGILTALKNTLFLLQHRQYQLEVISVYQSDEQYVRQLPSCVCYRNLDQWRPSMPIVKSLYSRLYDRPSIQKYLLERCTKKNRYQVIVAYADGRATQLVSLVGTPCKIAWVHTDVFSHDNKCSQNIENVIRVYQRFRYIVTVSHFLKKEIQQRLPQSHHIHVVYNPILVDAIRKKAALMAPHIPDEYIVAVGRLSYEKGIDMLIHAYHVLPDALKAKYSLYIIGDGEEREKLVQLVQRLKLATHVHFLGKLDNPYPYIRHASLAVVPSLFEGFGLVAIEAQVLGVPVLATKTGGLEEILDHGKMGFLCERTKESMAKAIQKSLAEASTRQLLIEKAYQGLQRFNDEYLIKFFENMQEKFLSLYANGPIGNHGCEALYRSLGTILNVDQVFALDDSDEHSTLWQTMRVKHTVIAKSPWKKLSYQWFRFKWTELWNHPDYAYYRHLFRAFENQIVPGNVYASIGGDNYCYGASKWLYALNQLIRKRKGHTVLLGCSISPEAIDQAMLNDLSAFDLIIARESITYHALVGKGLAHVELVPDPAFSLGIKECELPSSFIPGMTVGINISPLITKHEPRCGIVLQNIKELIYYILGHTSMNVALIPHVVLPGNDDLELLRPLYEEFCPTGRISLFPDSDCCTLKFIIGQCRFLVASRTHASIAAYSQSVPTLVIGYSVKAEGIAKDLFGSADNYVLDIRSLTGEKMVLERFQWLMAHEDDIKTYYCRHLQRYLEPISRIKDLINQHLFSSHA